MKVYWYLLVVAVCPCLFGHCRSTWGRSSSGGYNDWSSPNWKQGPDGSWHWEEGTGAACSSSSGSGGQAMPIAMSSTWTSDPPSPLVPPDVAVPVPEHPDDKTDGFWKCELESRVRMAALTPYEGHMLMKFFGANGGDQERADVAKLMQLYGKGKGAGEACRRLGKFLVDKNKWTKGQVGVMIKLQLIHWLIMCILYRIGLQPIHV